MPRPTDHHPQAPLPVPVLVARLLALLDTCAHLAEQIPAATLHQRLPDEIDTFDGREPLHTVLARTVRHVARHAQQLERVLRQNGIEPRPGLPSALLEELGPLE